MPQFLLLNYLPVDGGPPADEAADQHQRWQAFAQDLVDAGLLISNTGLKGPDAARPCASAAARPRSPTAPSPRPRSTWPATSSSRPLRPRRRAQARPARCRAPPGAPSRSGPSWG